jgi:hypothetical protein
MVLTRHRTDDKYSVIASMTKPREDEAVIDRDTAAAWDTLRGRYPEAMGSPAQIALALIQTVAQAVGAAPDSLAPQPAEASPPASENAVTHPRPGAVVETTDLPVDQVLAALSLLRWLRAELDTWEPLLIAAARELGTSWAHLAPALGVASRQAAERRYLRMRVPELPLAAGTREARVDAERDRRAGQRAVSQWARDNGAELRQLAGQITALTNLHADARRSVDLLHRGLGQTDPATLVALLADTQQHLGDHPTLADQVDDMTHNADRVRRTAQQQRHQPRR